MYTNLLFQHIYVEACSVEVKKFTNMENKVIAAGSLSPGT